MNVWRIHLKNDVANDDDQSRTKLKDMCLKDGIIGVGWSKITTRADSADEIRRQAKEEYPNSPAGFKAVNAMRKMQPATSSGPGLILRGIICAELPGCGKTSALMRPMTNMTFPTM